MFALLRLADPPHSPPFFGLIDPPQSLISLCLKNEIEGIVLLGRFLEGFPFLNRSEDVISLSNSMP